MPKLTQTIARKYSLHNMRQDTKKRISQRMLWGFPRIYCTHTHTTSKGSTFDESRLSGYSHWQFVWQWCHCGILRVYLRYFSPSSICVGIVTMVLHIIIIGCISQQYQYISSRLLHHYNCWYFIKVERQVQYSSKELPIFRPNYTPLLNFVWLHSNSPDFGEVGPPNVLQRGKCNKHLMASVLLVDVHAK